jgi:hypothetical protein
MTFQERAELLLERHRTMVLGLPIEIDFDLVQVRITDGERAVARLPRKSGPIGVGLVNPFRGIRLDQAEGVGQRDLARQRGEQMNVIEHAAGGDERAPFGAEDAADVFE